jgi:hypothetical protein
MVSTPEKIPLLVKFRENGLSGAFVGLVLLAMAGWVYLLGTLFLKFMLWCFS